MSPVKAGMFNILLVLGFLAFPFTHVDSKPAEPLPPAQKAQIEVVIHDYIVANPEVLIEATQALQKKQQESMQQQAQEAIKQNITALFHSPTTAVGGNVKGNTAIVEFFDYQCGHCKRVAPALANIVKADPQVSVILKQLPIFGANSELAAKAVLAAQKQNKAWELHQAIMLVKQPLTDKLIWDLAKANGLDVAALQKEIANPAYTAELKANQLLADKLGVMGTPAFIVANGINDPSGKSLKSIYIPGAAGQAELQKAITLVRK